MRIRLVLLALATACGAATAASAAPPPASVYHALLKHPTPPPHGYTTSAPAAYSDRELAGLTALPLADVRQTFVGAVSELLSGPGEGVGLFYFVARGRSAAIDFLIRWRMALYADEFTSGTFTLLGSIPHLPVTLTRLTVLERNNANGLILAGANRGPVIVAGIAAGFDKAAAEQLLHAGLTHVAQVDRALG